MEIERKWMVKGQPSGLPVKKVWQMLQGYICVHPTVRIRKEAAQGGSIDYILCIKGKGRLARQEIEMPITAAKFDELAGFIGRPLIVKQRTDYLLPDGLTLEVSLVDEGMPTQFMYAEVEFPTEEAALAWQPESCGLKGYLCDEVTHQPGQSMGAYWLATRKAEP